METTFKYEIHVTTFFKDCNKKDKLTIVRLDDVSYPKAISNYIFTWGDYSYLLSCSYMTGKVMGYSVKLLANDKIIRSNCCYVDNVDGFDRIIMQ